MFTLVAVLRSTTPILSATAMNRLLNSSSFTGWASVPCSASGCALLRRNSRLTEVSTDTSQPGSTIVVAMASRIKAGPVIRSPGKSASRSNTGASCRRPPVHSLTTPRGTNGLSLAIT